MNNKEYKKLTSQIRQDFNNKIQPYHIGNKCEVCGSTENLELHHKIPLSEIVIKLINSDIDKRQWRVFALGYQVKSGFTTLCRNCHRNLPEIKEEHKKIRRERFLKRKREERKVNRIMLIDKLPKYTNKKLYKNSQEKLKNLLRAHGFNHQTIGFLTINKFFIEYDLDFILVQGKRKSYREGDKVKKEDSHWLLTKKEDNNNE